MAPTKYNGTDAPLVESDGAGGFAPVTAPSTIGASALTSAVFTIAINTSLSAAVDLAGKALLRLMTPAAWDAANLTFQTSIDDVTYGNLYDATGTEYTVTAAASRSIILSPSDFPSMRFVKIRSGTSGTPVNQTAARTLTAIVRALA